MTATDELRRLLDERGVKWDVLQDSEGGEMTRWRDSNGRYVTAYDDGVVTFFADFYWGPTPRQAIDATLGRRTTTRTGKFRTKYGRSVPCCERCGYGIGDERWHYCPSCGAEVVDE